MNALTFHQQRHMIRAAAVACVMAAERRSLDFKEPGLLVPLSSVAEKIGRRPRRKTIWSNPVRSPLLARQAV